MAEWVHFLCAVASGFFCTETQHLILLQPPRRTAASSALTVSRKQSSIFLNAILYLFFFFISWAIASWLCEVHHFPDAQETEPKELLGPGFGASWGSMAGSRKLRSRDSCSSEWARLHTHCEGSLRIWLWVTLIFEYGISLKIGWRGQKLHDETHSFRKTQSRRKFPSSYVTLGPCRPKHII